MKRDQAEQEARAIVASDGIVMVVTFSPYGEEPDEADRFGYVPEAAASIFTHDEIVDTIRPESLKP